MKNPYRELGVETILLVEDDPWSRDSLATYFRIVKCRMHTAGNAVQAVAAVSRMRFDLILCEYQLPGMDGLTLMRTIGKIHPGGVKILFTSYPVRKLVEESARSGVHEVIRKPFTMEALEESLKRHFAHGTACGREPVGVE